MTPLLPGTVPGGALVAPRASLRSGAEGLLSLSGGVLTAGAHPVPPWAGGPALPAGGVPGAGVRELRSALLGLPWTSHPDMRGGPFGSLTDTVINQLEDLPWASDAARTRACLPLVDATEPPADPVSGARWPLALRDEIARTVLPLGLAAVEMLHPDVTMGRALGTTGFGMALGMTGIPVIEATRGYLLKAHMAFPKAQILYGKSKKDARDTVREVVTALRRVQGLTGPWWADTTGRTDAASLVLTARDLVPIFQATKQDPDTLLAAMAAAICRVLL